MAGRVKVDRSFMRSLVATGKYQDFADESLRGFGVKVAPGGTIAFTIRWQKPDGKQGRKVIGYFPEMSPGEARELARKEGQNVDKKGDTTAEVLDRRRRKQEAARATGSGITLNEFLDGQYGDAIRTQYKSADKTIKRLKASFPDLLNRPLGDITGLQVEKWRAMRFKAGLKASTLEREVNALRGVFTRAITWGLLSDHPLQVVDRVKLPDDGRVRWLSNDEEQRLRKALADRRSQAVAGRATANEWREKRKIAPLPDLMAVTYVDHLEPAVLLSLNTGIRLGEVLSLKWQDVDLDRATVAVRASNAKSSKTRHVPLNREAKAALTAWKDQSDGVSVFANANGKPMTGFKTAWNALLRKAGIGNFTWHDMRHHFASSLVMAGVDLNTVRELLGHADLKMTLRYAHLAPEHKAAAVAKLDRHDQSTGAFRSPSVHTQSELTHANVV